MLAFCFISQEEEGNEGERPESEECDRKRMEEDRRWDEKEAKEKKLRVERLLSAERRREETCGGR